MPRNYDHALYQEYLKSVADYTLKPFAIDPEVPLRYDPEVDDYVMSAGMDMTPGGRIWLAWFAQEDGDQTVLILAHSDDGGETFSKPDFIVDPGFVPGGLHVSAVVGNLWTAPDGRLFLYVMQSIGHFDARCGVWQAICENPDSDQPKWSTPERIWHGAALNKPTVLENGTWILPVALWARHLGFTERIHGTYRVSDLFHDLDPCRGSNILASTDQGRTWEWRGHVGHAQDASYDEPMIVERRDASFLMYMRNGHGMTQSTSTDEGRTWTTPVKTSFTSASARFFFRKLQSGKLLLVRYANPVFTEARSHMTAYLSDDDGATWKGGLLLDEREAVSYPDGFQAPDGRIFVQYDRKRECGEILLAVFTEDDVLAGKDVSGKVTLRHPIVQSRSARLESQHA